MYNVIIMINLKTKLYDKYDQRFSFVILNAFISQDNLDSAQPVEISLDFSSEIKTKSKAPWINLTYLLYFIKCNEFIVKHLSNFSLFLFF